MFYIEENNKILGYSESKETLSEFFPNKTILETNKKIITNEVCGTVFEDYLQTEEYKQKLREYNEKEELFILRSRRELECFSIINRGKPWYDTLTEEQQKELDKWYKEWLNITETKIIPNKPKWLK